MVEITEALINAVEAGNVWVIVALGAITLIFKAKSIVTFWDDRRRIKLSQLKEALDCECIKGDTRKFLESELESEYYRLATGVKLEKEVREALIQTHQKCNGELRFDHFRRALSSCEFENGKLRVEISLFTKITGWYGAAVSLFSFISLLFVTLMFLSTFTKNFVESLQHFALGVPLAFISLMGVKQYLELYSAKLVKAEMDKQPSSSSINDKNNAQTMALPKGSQPTESELEGGSKNEKNKGNKRESQGESNREAENQRESVE